MTLVKLTKQDAESQRKFKEQLQDSAKIKVNIDPNINYNILHNLIKTQKELNLSPKLVRFNKYKWISRGIINNRDNLYQVHKMTDPDSIDYAIQAENLKIINSILLFVCVSDDFFIRITVKYHIPTYSIMT